MHRDSNRESSSDAFGASLEAVLAKDAFRIHDGDCWVFVAFDAGYSIDLDEAQKKLSTATTTDEAAHREELSHRHRAPTYLQFSPPPLRIDQPASQVQSMDFAGFRAASRVECTLFDFGAVSVGYRIPIGGREGGFALEELVPLAQVLGENSALRADAKRRIEELSTRLGSAIERPGLVELVEDYTVYHARRWSPSNVPAATAIANSKETIARLLLAEQDELSNQAVDAAVCESLSYGPGDIAVIDWNAAILLDARAEDTLAVLEFANIELLEMRFLDDRLDSILDRSYASLLKRDSRRRISAALQPFWDRHRVDRRRLAALQMDSAMLFEGINNALKLIGDQHLARLYALAARRFHLADWDQSILRKLHTVDGLYQKLGDEQSTRRMEVLEWIIIILITVSILLPFIYSGAK